jgi:medium-chain acyl-[acyl-carrier-protein] hydrolase
MQTLERHRSNGWLTGRRTGAEARFRLFCLPYAGGDSRIFAAWQAELPSWVEVCPVELPGRGALSALSPCTRSDELVERLLDALIPELDRPFGLFGHSMGSLLAFELARRTRAMSHLPPCELLLASAHRAPHLPATEAPIHDAADGEFLAGLRRLNGTPPAVLESRELMDLRMRTLRADFSLCETYVYSREPPLACAIIGLGGLRDRSVARAELTAWREHTAGAFLLRMFPGDHFFVRSARSLLLCELARALNQLRAARNL